MKTNVVMLRDMWQFKVSQRTNDGYFDANALLNQWNSVKGNTKREMKRFLDSPKTIEFVNEIQYVRKRFTLNCKFIYKLCKLYCKFIYICKRNL